MAENCSEFPGCRNLQQPQLTVRCSFGWFAAIAHGTEKFAFGHCRDCRPLTWEGDGWKWWTQTTLMDGFDFHSYLDCCQIPFRCDGTHQVVVEDVKYKYPEESDYVDDWSESIRLVRIIWHYCTETAYTNNCFHQVLQGFHNTFQETTPNFLRQAEKSLRIGVFEAKVFLTSFLHCRATPLW